MTLKGFLVVVSDIERSLRYYESLFGLKMLFDNGGNMLLEGGLFLQEDAYWRQFTGRKTIWKNHSSELYFEEENIDAFAEKLEALYPETEYVNRLMTHSWGQRVLRFYDLDGNLIEVGTPLG